MFFNCLLQKVGYRQGWDSYFSFEAINIIASLLKNEAINIIATNFKKVDIIASLLLKFR
jgi:hypothetical protein